MDDCLICHYQAKPVWELYKKEAKDNGESFPPFSTWFKNRNKREHYRHQYTAETLNKILDYEVVRDVTEFAESRDEFRADTRPMVLECPRWTLSIGMFNQQYSVDLQRSDPRTRVERIYKVGSDRKITIRDAVHAMAEHLAKS